MDAFAPIPPKWTEKATHSVGFYCPSCKADATEAQDVWLNRRAPVTGYDRRRKWQEFYLCECNTPWWSWSSDRPSSNLGSKDTPPLF
ncbi:MAG: hypothetical protein QNJ65_03745 [Xenococcaceae cyanobacterium MO_234.B1]|nr:hypothetical protein [Xenococcaceae cyanobacterium MO_234.B1]